MSPGPIAVLLLLAIAPLSAGCHKPGTRLPSLLENIHLAEPSSVAALVALGSENGICFAIENPGPELLTRPLKVSFQKSRISSIVTTLLPPGRRFSITEKDGVILIRRSDQPRSSLDEIIPEFTVKDASFAIASAALDGRLFALKNPGKGVAGSILGNPGDENIRVKSIHERGRSVRDLLGLILTHSDAGGVWISGRCDNAPFSNGRLCWDILPYSILSPADRRVESVITRLLFQQTLNHN